MENMDYENFIRNAFKCDRGQDPGGLAEASFFEGNISRVKIAVGYAMAIYARNRERIDSVAFFDRLLAAQDRNGINELIREFREQL